jgi:hypothetical protein
LKISNLNSPENTFRKNSYNSQSNFLESKTYKDEYILVEEFMNETKENDISKISSTTNKLNSEYKKIISLTNKPYENDNLILKQNLVLKDEKIRYLKETIDDLKKELYK